mmetsp:Transcript_89300/g.251345  ORF Transcript_89300/g.251345 Transcript_89300/m.251345 type:complete len:298 (+) Transcript_89300:328-1221(+)
MCFDCTHDRQGVQLASADRAPHRPKQLRRGHAGRLTGGGGATGCRGSRGVALQQERQGVQRSHGAFHVELFLGRAHSVCDFPQVVALESDLPARVGAEEADNLARRKERQARNRGEAYVSEDLPQVRQVRDLGDLEALAEGKGGAGEAARVHALRVLLAMHDGRREEVVGGARNAHTSLHQTRQLRGRRLRQRFDRAVRETVQGRDVRAMHPRKGADDHRELADVKGPVPRPVLDVRGQPPVQVLVRDAELAHGIDDHRDLHGGVELDEPCLQLPRQKRHEPGRADFRLGDRARNHG